MALPILQATGKDSVLTPNTVDAPEPGTTVSGDLAIIIAGNDHSGTSTMYDNGSFKPDGFTLIEEVSSAAGETQTAAWWKAISGSEAWPLACPFDDPSQDNYAFALRLTGVNTADPIHVVGSTIDTTATSTTHVIPGLTTTLDDCLVIYCLCFDGGDGFPFSTMGTGFVQQDEIQCDALGTSCAGVFGTKEMASPGGSGDVTITASIADNATAFQFAVASALTESPSLVPLHPQLNRRSSGWFR